MQNIFLSKRDLCIESEEYEEMSVDYPPNESLYEKINFHMIYISEQITLVNKFMKIFLHNQLLQKSNVLKNNIYLFGNELIL